MSSSSEKSIHKRAMEADPTSGDEQVQPKKRNPRREEAPAPPPVPAAGPPFSIRRLEAMMKAKIERDRLAPKLATPEIPTLQGFKPPTYFHTRALLHVRDAGTKGVLTAAKYLLGISFSVGGKPLKRCSGFWIDWNEESKTGIVLTTAHLIRTKNSPVNIWLGGEEYASHANVVQKMTRRYKYIPRPHLGMTFEAIKLLEPAHVEKLWRMYNIDDGLVVQQVSKGSHAEKFGIQRGDIIECINGKCISTTIELENVLASICKDSSDNLNDLNVEIHVSVGVFHTLKKHQTTGELPASVSDLGEVIMD